MVEKLKIYKATYTLSMKIYDSVPRMERMHKHIIGTRMVDTSLELFTHIVMANKAEEKKERLKYLNDYLVTFEKLRIYIRICKDRKLLQLSPLTDMYLIIEDISRQLAGWRKNTLSGMLEEESSAE